jgi:hypothetical protein
MNEYDDEEMSPTTRFEAALEKLRDQPMFNGLTAGEVFTDGDLILMHGLVRPS